MKNRQELAEHFAELKFSIGAEIGVLGGKYSAVLCQANPNLKLYCIDSWGMGDRRHGEYHIRKYEEAKVRLAPYNVVLINKSSMDAVLDFEDESLDFVYIDANHSFQHVRDDIREWCKKVRIGGIVSGHDYYVFNSGSHGVIRAVDEYIKEFGYKLNLTDWNNNSNDKDNRQPSWYFIKT